MPQNAVTDRFEPGGLAGRCGDLKELGRESRATEEVGEGLGIGALLSLKQLGLEPCRGLELPGKP